MTGPSYILNPPARQTCSSGLKLDNVRRCLDNVCMPRYYVYVLQSSKDKKLYIGVTNNLEKRLKEHARGDVESTKNRRFLKLIHYEYFINKKDAEAREKYLKSGYGHRQLREILKHTLE